MCVAIHSLSDAASFWLQGCGLHVCSQKTYLTATNYRGVSDRNRCPSC